MEKMLVKYQKNKQYKIHKTELIIYVIKVYIIKIQNRKMPIHPLNNLYVYKNPVIDRGEETRQRAKRISNTKKISTNKDISSTFDIKKQECYKDTNNLLILNMNNIVP